MTVQIAKTRISPSDLTFGWTGCRKCFWLKYRHGVSHQGPFPGIVTSLSARQERWYKQRHSHDFWSGLPSGIVDSTGKMLESTPIVVNGVQTPFNLGGKYDFLISYDDGTFGVIDTKVVSHGGKAQFYWAQLAAYDYILSNPMKGDPRRCTTLGLMVWEIADAERDSADVFKVGFSAAYEPVEVDPNRFETFIAEVVTVLLGEMPASAERCSNCDYATKRGELSALNELAHSNRLEQ